ncbi:MAG: TonB-dependent siderophore receptor [Acinetobacter sp.]|nr:TonB-dependent siderophore receptor [Acinetobacter sp.]
MKRSLLSQSIFCTMSFGVLVNTAWANTHTHPTQQLETIVVQAQDGDESLTTNTSATKFAHDVLDVPFSRALVSKEQLQQQDIQRIDDAIHHVSGVFHQTNYGGGFWENYSFRGFGTDPDMGATLIRNGLSANRGISSPKDPVNIESLDFLKGAATAIYGRGEVGGALNVSSKKPQWHHAGEINARVQSEEQYRLSFEHTAPLHEQLAYRIALSGEHNQSFRDYVYSKQLFVSPQLSWKVSEQTQLDFDSEFLQRNALFDRGVSTVNGQFVMNPRTYTGEPDDDENVLKDQFYQLRLNHQLGTDWQLKSAVSHKHTHLTGTSSEARRMLDAETLSRFRRHRDNESRDTLAQTEILGSFDGFGAKHDVVIGAEVGQLDYTQKLWRINHSTANPNTINIYAPQYNVYLPAMPLNANYLEQQRYAAINLQDQIFFNHQWSILAGVRFDYVKQRFDDYKAQKTGDKTHQQWSPRLGVNYHVNDQWSAYANLGQSFAMNSRLDRLGQSFAPERGTNYEVGVKYQPNTQSLISVAVFNADKRNVLTTDPVDSSYYTTAGKVGSRGLELDVNYAVSDRVQVNAHYAYTDAQVKQDPVLAKGARLSNIPKHSATLSGHYEFLQQDERKAGVGASVAYVGERSGHYEDIGFNLPAYTLLNAHAYYAPSARSRYQLNIHNVLNKDYYLASYSNMWVQPGEPLNASISAQWKF